MEASRPQKRDSMQLNEEACPVPESVLGQLYRASPQGLPELIETVSPDIRAMLAVYCYRRAHLASIGFAIASSCTEEDLHFHGGNLGVDLFAKSRAPQAIAPQLAQPAAEDLAVQRRADGGHRPRFDLATLCSKDLVERRAPRAEDEDEDAYSVFCFSPHSLQVNSTRVCPARPERGWARRIFRICFRSGSGPALTEEGLFLHRLADQPLGLFAHFLLRHCSPFGSRLCGSGPGRTPI